MKPPVLTFAAAALAALCVGACASAPLTRLAAAMPVFTIQQSHPAVIEAMGSLKTYVCLSSSNQASIVDDALNTLRSRAAAKGADALVDYRYRFLTAGPRAQQCRRSVEAEAVAVVLGNGTSMHASTGHAAPG